MGCVTQISSGQSLSDTHRPRVSLTGTGRLRVTQFDAAALRQAGTEPGLRVSLAVSLVVTVPVT
jgi:hypothetical protein